ncbi:MAG: carboxypeptidase-like regulatory domain-containing protein, partial [Candidatus Marinimicrobia bacterium]|nr:carboxypeptidase-like regulatory domain-containing protein [Candidatus Neomarinimicrobiota bacterium]
MKCLHQNIYKLLVGILITAGLLQAQTIGKISGRVYDEQTEMPLVGANVLVVGQEIGASTDEEGNFTILRVYPGTYDLKVTYIGYATATIKEVRVYVDRTTFLNIPMKVEGVQMEEVVVTAEKPIIVRDKTFSSSSVDYEDIEKTPAEGIRDIMDLNTSFQQNPDGTYSLRGSGSFDINFMIDGVTQENSNTGIPGTNYAGERANTSWKYDFNPLGIKQMELISGGFSAEYGNAQSGVVKIVTKEGSSKFQGEFRYEYRPPGKYHFGDYLYSKNHFEWQKWGNLDAWFKANYFQLPPNQQLGDPYLENGVPYNLYTYDEITGTYEPYRVSLNDSLAADYYNRWLSNRTPEGKSMEVADGFTWVQIYDTTETGILPVYKKVWQLQDVVNKENKLGVYDYRELAYQRVLFGFGGPIGNLPGWTFFFSGEKRQKPTRLPTNERYTDYDNVNLTTVSKLGKKLTLRSMFQYQHSRNGIFSGSDDVRWASPVGSISFHCGQTKYLLVTVPPKDEFAWIQSFNFTYLFSPEAFFDLTFSHTYERYEVNTTPLSTKWQVPQGNWDEGYTRLVWDPSATSYNQDVRTHIWAVRGDYTNQISHNQQLKTGFQATLRNMHYSSVSSAYTNALVYRTGFAEYYKAKPLTLAAYIQDRMEFEGMIANLGLRADAFNNFIDVPADEWNPFYMGIGANAIGNPETKKSTFHFALSPRIGLSFPIGEATAFRLQYGHFYAVPNFRHTLSKSTSQGWIMYGNADLGFLKTISYEFGVQHSLWGTHKVDVVAYFKDMTSQTTNIRRHISTGSVQRSATDPYAATYVNTGYGTSKGVEIEVEKYTTGRLKYRFKYTLSRTSGGVYGPSEIWADNDPNRPYSMRKYIQRANDNITAFDKTHALSTVF